MSSPDREGGHPGASCVFAGCAVTRQTPLSPPQHHPAETLSLRRSQLERIPDSVLESSSLTYLCLEGNLISSIPESMFISLPKLLWLDLRKNQITSLPPEIGSHRCLKTLLLEGNPISELPPELGNVISLSGLNLRDCPVRFPPQHILHQGLQVILQYLRTALAQRPVITSKTPPGDRIQTMVLPLIAVSELPALEKLQLSELDEQEDSVDEDDLQRFRELKERLTLLDRSELASVAQGRNRSNSQTLPTNRNLFVRKKTTTEAGVIPKLPLFDTESGERPEERRRAEKEKQAVLEQRRKSREALQKWRTKAKLAQERRAFELKKKKLERQRKQEEEEASKSGLERGDCAPSVEENRSASELQRQIRTHVEKMQERRSNPKGPGTEQVAAAEDDVRQMTKLQTLVLERKRNLGKELEKTFTIFNTDTWSDLTDK
ncbi:leucine-rich repeat-containing protein 27-like [Salarias fasciatus]|uniref:leucine-rich repeat-containing protein 27-like n=1 Tax=Salarias fasciatus TaxID=181472 RepID=UPI001176D944|nr:leucine-rich repeat-containing protein 27 [Salarias fasciatus]